MLEEVGRYDNGHGETVVVMEDSSAIILAAHSKIIQYPVKSLMLKLLAQGSQEWSLGDAKPKVPSAVLAIWRLAGLI